MNKPSQKIQLQKLFIAIRSSLWFLPALAILCAIAMAVALTEIDKQFGRYLSDGWPRIFATEAEGGRAMLSAIAGSMATIAGVAFSITIVALALASTQYTSRLLRTFMRDRATQLVLGVFVGVYIYCLLILRSLSNGISTFVPSVSVLGGLALAIIAVGFFIFFIHHISSSIQAAEIAAEVTQETLAVIDAMPAEAGTENDEAILQGVVPDASWQPIPAITMGYIQNVDEKALVAIATQHRTIFKMECCTGNFIAFGMPLLQASAVDIQKDELVREVNNAYAIATFRTIEQDPVFGFRQLVDIALKALSPGINDTTTAITCIDHLTVLLSRCAGRGLTAPSHFNHGQLRLITRGTSFADLVELSFMQILENAEGNTAVMLQMLIAITKIAQFSVSKQRKATLHAWVNVIEEVARRSVKSSYALDKIEVQINRSLSALQ